MTSKAENPQAFPHGDPVHGGCEGMTLRDYFAAAALQGILARTESPAERGAKSEIAEQCYFYADAMLRARGE